MSSRSSKPHRDANQMAKHILDQLTGDAPKEESPKRQKRGAAGGVARASKLTPNERSDVARLAATARWEKTD